MQSLKNIVTNGAMILALLVGLTVSATAEIPSFENVKAKAEKGDKYSQFEVGVAYIYGKGVRQDYGNAMKWFRKAADQNNAEAQGYIGTLYENGEGVRQNKVTAKEWYGKSCDNGSQTGCDEYKRLNHQGY